MHDIGQICIWYTLDFLFLSSALEFEEQNQETTEDKSNARKFFGVLWE